MRYTEAIGIRLGELLKENKLTQRAFALCCGVSRITINRTIKGKIKTITFEILIKYCETLNISFADFFSSDLFSDRLEMEEKKKGRRII